MTFSNPRKDPFLLQFQPQPRSRKITVRAVLLKRDLDQISPARGEDGSAYIRFGMRPAR